MIYMNKTQLIDIGLQFIRDFKTANPKFSKKKTKVTVFHEESNEKHCGLFWNIPPEIQLWPKACAGIGLAGMAWSFPAYKIDRSPSGVLAHEYGHAVDWFMCYPSSKRQWRSDKIISERVSSYEPNSSERFAESMRLFITNPDLLRRACPHRFEFLTERGLVPPSKLSWEETLVRFGAPDRQIRAAQNWINRSTHSQRTLP